MVRLLLPDQAEGQFRVVSVDSYQSCLEAIHKGFRADQVRLTFQGQDLRDLDFSDLPELAQIEVEKEVLGGKGGFGSLLRIAAAQKKNFNNFDSSRDSNGRRLRDIKNEIRLKEFVKRKRAEKKLLDEELASLKKQQENTPTDTSVAHRAEVEAKYKQKVNRWQSELTLTIKKGILKKKEKKLSRQNGVEDTSLNNKETEMDECLGKRVPVSSSETNDSSSIMKKLVLPSEDPIEIVPKNSVSHLMQNDAAPVQVKLDASTVSVQPNQTPEFEPIELNNLKTIDDLNKLSLDHIKHELKRLGLKCGGAPKDRIQRLWDIKTNPANLLNPKYLAK